MTSNVDLTAFAFGKNWSRFLSLIDEDRIESAEKTLVDKLNLTSLEGKTFLDAGSGSGLFSLAARRLGARVHSFDYDPESVACTRQLKSRYFPDDSNWTIEEGSVLDENYLATLGPFDITYSWGVLHHTGNTMFRFLVLIPALVRTWGPTFVRDSMHGHPLRTWRDYGTRGMSAWHDLVDWVGGYPFEVARPETIFEFYRDRGFDLHCLTTCGGGLGCNEFVFRRADKP
jgi:2-polyprenyl-6-hydroxyphenyl methylase/3-demethylubiquinone-9 3-methyltransferase